MLSACGQNGTKIPVPIARINCSAEPSKKIASGKSNLPATFDSGAKNNGSEATFTLSEVEGKRPSPAPDGTGQANLCEIRF